MFKLAPDGTAAPLYPFCSQPNCADGAAPVMALLPDAAGNFYGVTLSGGAYNEGTVFKLAPDGTETVLHSFGNDSSDGLNPLSSLVADANGNLYGTTMAGGAYNFGTVFKVTPGGKETVFHAFAGTSDGATPGVRLLIDGAGNLYGATVSGGANDEGVVFRFRPDGKEKLLYSFTGGADGGQPYSGLIADDADNLYGTTSVGGKGNCAGNTCGGVYKIAPDGTETPLLDFDGRDGGLAVYGLLADKNGNLYGNATHGGRPGCVSDDGCGVIFKLAPDGTETELHRFTGGGDGGNPQGDPIVDGKGNIYFNTYEGGAYGYGTVVKVKE